MKRNESLMAVPLDRRKFLGLAAGALASSGLLLSGCQAQEGDNDSEAEDPQGEGEDTADAFLDDQAAKGDELPAADPDPETTFGIDRNINVDTIDDYLGRDDTVYRDVRMLFDPADYAAIGGNAELSSTIEGFRIVPYPFIATLPRLTVEGRYEGDTLFSVVWGEDNRTIESVQANYVESQQMLEEAFPKWKNIFLMCGGSGYAGITKIFLTYMGWDENKIYNIGGNWDYTGIKGVSLISYDQQGKPTYRLWRADYAIIDFEHLTPAGEEGTSSGGTDTETINGGPQKGMRRGTKACVVA